MRERTRVKDDCMSNLRHGDYNYVTFALVLFFLSPSILSSRNHHLIQYEGQGYFFVCAHVCIYTHMQRMHIIQNTSSLAIIQYSELMMVLPDIFFSPSFRCLCVYNILFFCKILSDAYSTSRFDRERSHLFLCTTKTFLLFICTIDLHNCFSY